MGRKKNLTCEKFDGGSSYCKRGYDAAYMATPDLMSTAALSGPKRDVVKIDPRSVAWIHEGNSSR